MVINPCHLFMALVHLCFRCFQRKKLAQKVNEPGLTGNSIWAGLASDRHHKKQFPNYFIQKNGPQIDRLGPPMAGKVLKGQASKTILQLMMALHNSSSTESSSSSG